MPDLNHRTLRFKREINNVKMLAVRTWTQLAEDKVEDKDVPANIEAKKNVTDDDENEYYY